MTVYIMYAHLETTGVPIPSQEELLLDLLILLLQERLLQSTTQTKTNHHKQ
jgi:hypothetical protein